MNQILKRQTSRFHYGSIYTECHSQNYLHLNHIFDRNTQCCLNMEINGFQFPKIKAFYVYIFFTSHLNSFITIIFLNSIKYNYLHWRITSSWQQCKYRTIYWNISFYSKLKCYGNIQLHVFSISCICLKSSFLHLNILISTKL